MLIKFHTSEGLPGETDELCRLEMFSQVIDVTTAVSRDPHHVRVCTAEERAREGRLVTESTKSPTPDRRGTVFAVRRG